MRRFQLRLSFVTLAFVIVAGCAAQSPVTPKPSEPSFARGINFGNALEAPNEGDWGLTIREEYVDLVADAGFDTVRLPVKWSGHAAETAPYTIDPLFAARVDEVVEWILDRGLAVIIDFHHYDEMSTAPGDHTDRWLSIWRQVAERYRDAPPSVAFELLNEPNEALGGAQWNDMLAQALTVVRETNPTRTVVIGPGAWNAIGALDELSLPDDDALMLTVHFYEPFAFTHQGAEWVSPSPPTGVTWTGAATGPAGGWHDWSWDTEREYADDGLEITFLTGWAGFYLHADQPVTGYDELVFTTSRAVDLLILCNATEAGATPITTIAEVEVHVDLTDCGADGDVPRIFLQNGTPDAQPPFTVHGLELRGQQGTLPLLSTELGAVAAAFDAVERWASEHGDLPVLVGEFGAYEAADMASRVAWTAAVRRAAEERGFGWAYWEFGSGFGVYDPGAEAWRQPLLDALLPD